MTAAPKAFLPPLVNHIAETFSRYDGYVLDVWGVLHDGIDPYDGVVEALQLMQHSGKKVYLLSNSPLRAAAVQSRALDPKGLHAGLYNGIVTSGEVAFEYMNTYWQGAKIYRFWQEEHEVSIASMPHTNVENVEEADVIFAGLVPYDLKLDSYDAALQCALEKNIPLVCANPDRQVNFGNDVHLTTGTYAERYELMGGKVTFIGKPYPMVYERVLAALNIPTHRVLAVGDSLHTDVQGAVNAGIDVAWNLPGIHWEEVRAKGPLDQPNPLKLAAALTRGASPTYMMMGLKP